MSPTPVEVDQPDIDHGLDRELDDAANRASFDPDALQGLWEQIQPTLAGLDTDQILDTIGTWAKDLDVPLVKDVPDDVIDNIKNGAKVPLKSLIADK